MAGSIRTVDLETVEQSGKGPGAILVDVDPITPDNIVAIVNGTASGTTGRHIGGLTDTPTYTESDETVDRTENIVGLNADLVGSYDVQKTSVTLSFEIAKMTIQNFLVVRPNYEVTQWDDGAATAPVVFGTKLQRSGPIMPSHHLKNVTLVVPRPDTPTGFLYVVENAINVADDHEYSPDENGVITGVSVEMKGFSLGTSMDAETGDFGTPSGVYVLDPVAAV